MSLFQKAVKHESKLRLAIAGPSGAGKTYTALRLAKGLGKKVALIDTERGSASKYADEFEFDVLNLDPPYHPDRFLAAIADAEKAGYEVCIIDSLSHAWNGPGGVLEIVDEESRRTKGNSYVAWGKGTPIQNKFIDGLTRARMHIIGTMRSKTEYVLEQVNGKSTPRKVGMKPVQRDDFEYEFDVALDMTPDNDAIVQKTRCSAIANGIFSKPGEDLAAILSAWLSGEAVPAQAKTIRDQFIAAMQTTPAFTTKQERSDWVASKTGGKSFTQLTEDDIARLLPLVPQEPPKLAGKSIGNASVTPADQEAEKAEALKRLRTTMDGTPTTTAPAEDTGAATDEEFESIRKATGLFGGRILDTVRKAVEETPEEFAPADDLEEASEDAWEEAWKAWVDKHGRDIESRDKLARLGVQLGNPTPTKRDVRLVWESLNSSVEVPY